MHPVNQIQQILQFQQLRQQQQVQALQQHNNRQQIQIFASPPNTNHNVSNPSSNQTTLFQIQQPTPNSTNTNGTDSNNNGIQIQPLQILDTSHNTQRVTAMPGISRIALIQQIQQRARQQAAQQQAHVLQQQQQQQQQQSNGGNAQFRQSIQQQMVAFIQQLQQFPPLFQHLQSNPQVLAQLLQQFKCKQEQNARDMQRQQLPSNNIQTFNMPTMANAQHIGALLRTIQAQRQQPQTVIPALENEQPMNRNYDDDVIILNDNNTKQLDFSQLKTMTIPIMEHNDKSPLKRTFTEKNDSPATKRRRLNTDCIKTITISDDDDNYNKKKKKKRPKKKKKEKAPSFGDIVDKAKHDGDQDVIGDFVNHPLISQIATKMFEIRQINNNERVATPEATANISKGLDVLLQAIDEMNDDSNKDRVSKRKNGELFVVDNTKENEKGLNKIKGILKTNYDNFFKLNENATFLANSSDPQLEEELKQFAQQFTDHYNAGLLNVFKTCSHQMFKDKFALCKDTQYTSIYNYFSVWNHIFEQHILFEMDDALSHYKIKNAIGLIFAVMDHLFSYSMYTYLCNQNSNKKQRQIADTQFITTSGNLLFSEFENDKESVKCIANVHICWLFEYWKKVLLQCQEPVKCLCRSYLINSAPNPYKNRLYSMITQTPHSPYTAVLTSKSRSLPPQSTVSHIKHDKAKTPPNTVGHFARRNTGTMSMNGIIKSNIDKNNIPSSSVCGKTFINANQCAQHTKDCKECHDRIQTISA